MPRPLHIGPSEDTPEITFDPVHGKLSVTGRSLPENAFDFYNPVIAWAKDYVSSQITGFTEIEIALDYFNSSSGRYLLELLSVFEEKAINKNKIRVIWFTEEDDELMSEKGEEFRKILDLPFEMRITGQNNHTS